MHKLSRRRIYEPYDYGADFERQIEEHKGLHGQACDLVPCPYERPDFKALDREQLDYYLYFRDCFFAGRPARTEIGYAWLLLTELINDREDPERGMERILKFQEYCRTEENLFPVLIEALDLQFSYAVANGLDIPRSRARGDVWNRILVSELLLPAPEHVSEDLIGLIVDEDSLRYDNPDPRRIRPNELFDAALPAVDAKMRELTGKGILETYGAERTEAIKLFTWYGRSDIPYFHEAECLVSYTEAQDSLKTFLGGMMRCCQRTMEQRAGRSGGTSVPRIFAKEYRDVVSGILGDGGIIRTPRRPKAVRGSARSFVRENADIPIVAESIGFSDKSPPSGFGPETAAYSKVEPPGERRYVPSKFRTPHYGCLSPEALDYYLWWRERAREGKYGMTDEGYLWLYKCELINAYEDHRYVLDQLAGLAKAYDRNIGNDRYGRTKKAGRTYLDYALMNCPSELDPTVYACNLSARYMLEKLLEGDADVPVSTEIMLIASDIGRKKTDRQIVAEFDDDCAHIAARVLAKVNQSIEVRGGIRGYCSISYADVHVEPFRNLRYCRWPDGKKQQTCRILDLYNSPWFCTDMAGLVRAVIAAVGNRRNPCRKKPGRAFGTELDGILWEEVDRWFLEKEMKAGAGAARDFSIDRSEVDRAQADLDRVTSIMSAGSAEEMKGPEEPSAETAVPGDPWQAFADRLNKGQKEYMRKALAGTLRSAKPMIEDAINAAAMDTVKDTVIEDGKAFEEYAEDARDALGLEKE